MTVKKTTTSAGAETKTTTKAVTTPMTKTATVPTATIKTETVDKKTEAAKKPAAKKPAAKKPAAKKEIKTSVYVQWMGKEVSDKEAYDKVKSAWKSAGHKVGDLKDVTIYIKPEENSIYYVVNGEFSGRTDC